MKISQLNTPLHQPEQRIKNQQVEDPEKLKDVCRQFESVFLNMMLKQMRATVTDGGLTEKSQARGIFESMYDETLADEMSKGQGIGLAKELYRQLSRTHTASNIKNKSQE